MNSKEQPVDELQKCELCERKLNPSINIFNIHTCLCTACFQQMHTLPKIVANNLSRFLIGNVI
jgi:hypothetical protein